MKVFRVTGKFRMGHVRAAPFEIEVIGKDIKHAHDTVLATLGSRHRVNRHQIWIEKEIEVSGDQVQDPAVAKKLAMVK